MLKSQTPRLCLAVALLLSTCRDGRADDGDVVTAVSGALLKELLEEEGYKGVTVDEPSKQFDVVKMKMDGKLLLIFCERTAGDIICRFSIAGTNATQRKINQWNESKKFFKAHLDKDGDPVMEHILVVKHGVTRKSVKAHVALMESGIKAFLKEVCD